MRRLVSIPALPASALCLVLALSALLSPAPAAAQPTLVVTPTEGEAGDILWLDVSGYTPGGYDATVRWDGVDQATFWIPNGGTTSVLWQIPAAALPGAYDLTVCAACDTYEFEQTDTERITVIRGELGATEWNVQPWAIEVTQGVRTDIPTRTPPSESTVLPSDSFVHVANRRTVVRVYPWAEAGTGVTSIPYLRADLYANIDGLIYGPIPAVREYLGGIFPSATLDELRGDMSRSWNFVLPDEWVSLPVGGTSRNMSLAVTINPGGTGECVGCDTDNTAWLNGQRFEHVGLNGSFALEFRPHLVRHTVDDGAGGMVEKDSLSLTDLVKVLKSFHELLPIADGSRGIRLYPWRYVSWTGDVDPAGFDTQMIRDYLPTGELAGNPDNDFYGFLFDRSWCAGYGYYSSPFFRANGCWRPQFVAVHEITHTIGQLHAGNGHGEAGGGGFDPSYPGVHGEVESNAYGIDVYDMIVFPPQLDEFSLLLPEELRHDYMSYGPYKYLSEYVWNEARSFLNAGTAGKHVSLADGAARQGSASFEALGAGVDKGGLEYIRLNGYYDGASFTPGPIFGALPSQVSQQGDLLVEFFDPNFKLTGQHWVTMAAGADEVNQVGGLVSESVPAPFDWHGIQVRDGNTMLHQAIRSPNAPQVSITDPVGGFQWPGTGTATLSWSGSDDDDDPLTYRVLGIWNQEYFMLAGDLTDETVEIDLSALPGGNWLIGVEASDGLRSAWSASLQGWIDPKAPQPIIVHPADGGAYPKDCALRATGLYADMQDASGGDSMNWILDGQTIAEGGSVDLPNLSPGTHTLELSAFNSYQMNGTTSVTFDIVAEVGKSNLLAPVDGAVGQPTPLPMSWSAVAGASAYRVQVAVDPNFSEVVLEQSALLDPAYLFQGPEDGMTYYWRVRAEQACVETEWSSTRSFTTSTTTAADVPDAFRALQLAAYPNPFNPQTNISFELSRGAQVELDVYDLAGRKVATLLRERMQAGSHSTRWDGTDGRGRTVASGVYVAYLRAETLADSLRLVLIK